MHVWLNITPSQIPCVLCSCMVFSRSPLYVECEFWEPKIWQNLSYSNHYIRSISVMPWPRRLLNGHYADGVPCNRGNKVKWWLFFAMLQGAVGCTCRGSRSIMTGATYTFFWLLACGIFFPTIYSREHPEHHNHLVYACWWNYRSWLLIFCLIILNGPRPNGFSTPKKLHCEPVNPMNINIHTQIQMKIYTIYSIYVYTCIYNKVKIFLSPYPFCWIGSSVRQFDWPRSKKQQLMDLRGR